MTGWVVLREGPATDGAALLRGLVAEVASVDPDLVRIGRRCPRCGSVDHGVPRLLDPDLDLFLSLSRSDGRQLVAVADVPVGVDIESMAGTAPSEGMQLAPGEHATPGPDGPWRTWTRKEAVLKATGRGVSLDPRTVRVDRPTVELDGRTWWLTDLDPAPGTVGALALATAEAQVEWR